MAALPNRLDLEAALLDALGVANADALKKVLDALGDPPDLTKLTSELWAEIETATRGAIQPVLESAFLASAEATSAAVGIGITWDTVNQQAASWARQYSYDLVRGLNDNSRAMLQQTVSSFFETPTTNQALQEKIARVFGPARAENIAVTEVTRAASAGEQAVVADLAAQGVRMVSIFQTSADDRVCAICGPADGKRSDQPGFQWPPLHVKCRCGVRSEVVIPDG